MLILKVPRNKLYQHYLEWINPMLKLSKGEIDILSSLLQLQYAHKYYPKDTLNEMLFSDETKEHIRKRLKINKRLFNKLFNSLEEKGIIQNNEINPALCKYPKDGRLKLFVSIECAK